ncbi:ArsR/SmtB family transcription factor [Acetanaerobacterium elongatum]|uniref:Transcriptional regulator, ArsR family n=1 Tax=Acetanaerobacterium elongatum TaxID=258515 RepID=A0A1H0DP40_9FIRM|nr:metalloregulator ArsR/SmtB family transcription factor [Acetanaerobacterium elongatum]SDN71912.1 transcriptional regulator, ArsR family [Acetanaerobacterium elongatum]
MVDIFKALSDETRLRILAAIWDDEMCVCEIEKGLKLTQSNASRHLTTLKNAGILSYSKKAQWAYYRISDTFRTEHSVLWAYLQQKLKNIPAYLADGEECKKCREQNLCNNND